MLLCKHLLVDGWNVIHADSYLNRIFDSGRGMRASQDTLAKKLSFIHDANGIRVTIVYDGRGDKISVEPIGNNLYFTEVYTPSFMTADELIEQLCAHSKHPENLLVASADNMIRLTSGGFEVLSISPKSLMDMANAGASAISHYCHSNKASNILKWRRIKMQESPFSDLDEIAEELRAVERALEEKIKLSKRQKKNSHLCENKNRLMNSPIKAKVRTTLKDLSSLGEVFNRPKGRSGKK